jgi:ribosomal protein S18 acetylase RimI-like enzyme
MFDPAAVPDVLRSADDALGARLEDAGLSSSQPSQQSIYDGWLLRYSPGKAKRARSVNAIGAGRIPLDAKLAAVEAFYRRVGLPCMYRITPFSQPAELDRVLDAAGYVAREETRVMWLDAMAFGRVASTVALDSVATAEFAAVAGMLRGSPPAEAAAESQRIIRCALPSHSLVARDGAAAIACGQIVIDGDCAGLFNMVTAVEHRGRGLATAIVTALLECGAQAGARIAYLQVDAANAPARHVYRKFGFRDRYAYWYRAAPSEVGGQRR